MLKLCAQGFVMMLPHNENQIPYDFTLQNVLYTARTVHAVDRIHKMSVT